MKAPWASKARASGRPERGGIPGSGSSRIDRRKLRRGAGQDQGMQGGGQAERKGIGFGVAGPAQDRAADVAGLVEPLGGKLQQRRGEWRAEPRARRGLS